MVELSQQDGWQFFNDLGPHKNDFRIYLSPHATHLGKVLQGILDELPPAVRYQMKTMDQPSIGEMARMDKIIMYMPREFAPHVWQAVARVHAQYPEAFQGRPGPGGGVQEPLNGVTVAAQHSDSAQTGTILAGKFIDEKIVPLFAQVGSQLVAALPNYSVAEQTAVNEAIKECLKNCKGFWAFKESASNEQLKMLDGYLQQAVCKEIVDASLQKRNRDVGKVQQHFIQLLVHGKRAGLSEAQVQDIRSNLSRHISTSLLQDRVKKLNETLGLGCIIDKNVRSGKSAGEGYRAFAAAVK